MNTLTTEDVKFLEHFGKKGMKWGVRNDRKDVQAVGKRAGEIIREARRAESPAARRAAADKYKAEIFDKIKSDDFKAKYNNANTMTKGEMATHIVLMGPLAALTIPATKNARKAGYDIEVDTAHEILRELRQP